jgi:hypothetical protein
MCHRKTDSPLVRALLAAFGLPLICYLAVVAAQP